MNVLLVFTKLNALPSSLFDIAQSSIYTVKQNT